MKFGVSTFITDQGISPTSLGTALEEHAFDSVFIAEHTHIPADRQTPYPGGGELPEMYYRTLDPFVALTAMGVMTERLLLGTGIALIPQRDPIITAKAVASLDLVSGGHARTGDAGIPGPAGRSRCPLPLRRRRPLRLGMWDRSENP